MLLMFLLCIVLNIVYVYGKKFMLLRFCLSMVDVCGLCVMLSMIVGLLGSIWKCFGSLMFVSLSWMFCVDIGSIGCSVLSVVSVVDVLIS